MGFLFARNKKNTIPEITGLQIQTSVNIVPIAICYGSPRIPMNIIYANGFRSVKQKSGSGGKGFMSGSGKGAVTGYKYYATFIGALCEGEVDTIPAMFENQNVYTPSTLPAHKNITFFNGSSTQAVWSVIQTQWPDDAFAYRHTAYVGFNDYELDASATIPQINFIISAKYNATCPLYTYTAPDTSSYLFDADPALCVVDFLTNAIYGVGFPLAYLDTTTIYTSSDGFDPDIGDAALSTYCQAVGFGWSIIINNQEPASSLLDRLFKNLVVAPVWTGSKLKFVPYADSLYSLNPGYDAAKASVALKYYAPAIQPLFALTDDDFIQSENDEDPIVFSWVDPYDVKNTVRVNFRDRYNYFNDNVAEAKDELQAELYGPRVDRLGNADEFTLMAYASNAAHMQLQRNMSVQRTATFRLGPQWCILEPMDILTLTESTLEIDQFPVRIRSIQEDEKGFLKFVVEEFRAGSMQPTLYNQQDNSPPDVNNSQIAPPKVNTPIIFEPTHELLVARGETNPTVIVGLSGGPTNNFDPNWGGADIYFSLDNVTYEQFGSQTGPSTMGWLVADLPAYSGANPDDTNAIQVDLTESQGILTSTSAANAAAGQTLCVIVHDDGTYELLAFTTATLVGPSQYTLTGLYRAMYGTQACLHVTGSKFLRINSSVSEFNLQTAYIGSTIYGKFPSFNLAQTITQDLSQATEYTYVPAGYGIGFATNPLAQDLQAPGPYTIDLQSYRIAATLDLGSIAGECAPVSFAVDLESV